jgi:hypothetical protein
MKQEKLETLPDLSEIEKRVFSNKGGISIGRVALTDEMRNLLREQANYLQSSQLWEILNASAANEAVNLALIQSEDFEHVKFAKALWHWSTFMRNIVLILGKK